MTDSSRLDHMNHTKTPNFDRTASALNRSNEYSTLDLQYQICSRYVKMTSQHFYQRELQLIQKSQKFLQKIGENHVLKDISTTQQSLTNDNFLDEDDPFGQVSKSRILLRKSQSNSSIRRTQTSITQALRQAKKKCSQKTSIFFTNMTSQFRKLKEKQSMFQKHEKESKKLQQKNRSKQQEAFIMRKRISDLQNQIQNKNKQFQVLKLKIQQLSQDSNNTLLKKSRSNENLLLNTQTLTFQKLKKYLQEKQLIVFKREKDVKLIHDKITQSINNIINGQSCVKCCELIKRIKESIMKYREYLEEESCLAEEMYNKYKLTLQ